MIDFSGQVAIVTGAGRGLGRSYALELARRGAAVVAADLDREAVDGVVGEIKADAGQALAVYADVGTPTGGASTVEAALGEFGTVDAVINNAGVLRHALFDEMTVEQIEAVLDSHVKGAFFVTQPAWRVMREKGYGRVLLTGSPAGAFGKATMANYAAAKAAMIGLAKVLSIEGAEFGIRTNVLLPNARTTPRTGDAVPGGTDNDRVMTAWAGFADRSEPERVAALVVYLVSRECASSGETFSVVGGRYARVFVAACRGWVSSGERIASAEEIADHFAEIVDEAGYAVPDSLAGEYEIVAAQLVAP